MNRTETLLITGNQKVIFAVNYEKKATSKFTREINYISTPYGVLAAYIKEGVRAYQFNPNSSFAQYYYRLVYPLQLLKGR
jgi:hypothetical protein